LYNHDKKERKKGHEFDDLKRKKANHKEKKRSLIFPHLPVHTFSHSKQKKENIGLSLSLSLKKKIIPHLSIYPSHLLFLAFIVVAISITIKPTASQCL
jgi:hypothetical protein